MSQGFLACYQLFPTHVKLYVSRNNPRVAQSLLPSFQIPLGRAPRERVLEAIAADLNSARSHVCHAHASLALSILMTCSLVKLRMTASWSSTPTLAGCGCRRAGMCWAGRLPTSFCHTSTRLCGRMIGGWIFIWCTT